MLPFSHSTAYKDSILSMSWGIVMFLPKCGSTPNILPFVLPMLQNISQFLLCEEFFCLHHFLWGLFILFFKITFLIYVGNFTTTKFLWPHAWSLSDAAIVTRPDVCYFLYNSIYIRIKFHFEGYHFNFCAALSSLLVNSLFQLTLLVKRCMHLPLEGKEEACFAIFTLNNRWRVTDCWQILK